MCGIVGYISNNDKLYEREKDHFMRYALALDTLRGSDSTGIVTVTKRFAIDTLKSLLPGDVFVHTKDYHKLSKLGWAQIGHNRAATRGTVTLENAHPFKFGPITLVHNGTLYNDGKSLPTHNPELEVDSMQIAHALAEHTPETAKEVLESIDGSFALVWTDRRDESINMARNEDRPLHVTFNQAQSVMWYMSDGNHLYSINKSFGTHECRGTSIFELDRMKHLKFKKGSLVPEVATFSPFVKAVSQHVTTTNTTAKNTKTGGDSSALRRAADKWGKTLKTGGGGTTTRGTGNSFGDILVLINNKNCQIPKAMLDALWEEMTLTPNDTCRFIPESAVLLPNNRYNVYGTMYHPEWYDTPWDMVLYDVPQIQYNAYKEQDWLVRPVGLCPCHTYDKQSSAVLGKLVHCNWKAHLEEQSKEAPANPKAREHAPDMLMPGPQGKMMYWSRLLPILKRGCVQCASGMMDAELEHACLVNNETDIVCESCVEDLGQTALLNHTTH